ncbi:amino acid/amide ABC transporter substrate-binding protein, HAAT family [Rhizobiales bacterium GAS191]|jgi:branched-chain amino acid transport system substrate-binding protein|nr:amino acid/amide ABC transporter substrate-binding protein, HAAT family [Rhizobiales bacterium GAS113]SED68499.1 amino acid/amide ABC transporter substrate-binding protein, HAAT family [Rhizobiales bacterium GAS188]SEE83305.1 amino acid/amide ABC transporter substrate-binding protein, HAAT family [Rhizobiales bacterium GAS191]
MRKGFTRLTRRNLLGTTAGAAAASLALPAYLRAQTAPIKVGILQPMTGALAFDGQQGQLGAELAIKAINSAGGIKSLGGAKLDMVAGDARSTPDGGTSEVERMQNEGVAAIVGGFASPICLAATQAAARYDLPYIVDVGVTDQIVQRGLKNTFRFAPGFGKVSTTAIDNLVKLNDGAGKPAKTVVLVHEDGLFGSGLAKLLQAELPKRGFEILDTIAHPTPARDMSNVALQIRAKNPDLIIPSSYYGEFVLLARTMQQQRIKPKGVYCVLNGAASNFRFVKEFPEAAQNVMDCNHWYDPRKDAAVALRKEVEQQGKFFTYNTALNYSCVLLLADAIERAASADRAKITTALASSSFAGHIMPYGPTQFVDGQNQGAAPVNLQVQGADIKVIFPDTFADGKPIFPVPA